MFKSAELGRKVSKAEFEKVVPELRSELVELQQRLRSADFPVIVVVGGVDGAGKSEVVNLLNEWMDPRGISTHAYPIETTGEQERPRFWRYWRDLPAAGTLGMFLSAWYTRPILDRAYRRIGKGAFRRSLDRIYAFEKVLADDGAMILKFWFHLSKKVQKQRLESLEKDPLQSWRVTPTDWERWRIYDRFVLVTEEALRETSTGQAPWKIVEGFDHRYRSLTVGTVLRDAIGERLDHGRRQPTTVDVEPADGDAEDRMDPVAATLGTALQRTVLSGLDLSLSVTKKSYERKLAELQGLINVVHRKVKGRGISMVAVFEGWDAGGKGGAIRRLTRALDARDYRVIPIAAPTDEERARHYLWRFWRQLPGPGRVTIFDRSWYGRVLVERVEGFAAEDEWRRAFAEINDFESQLTEFGILIFKFWLHISRDEQLRRFEERQQVQYKRWKITDEDWRNREKWDSYAAAVQEMVERTSTSNAPWTLVEGNSKRYARLKVLRTVAEGLENALEGTDDSVKKKKQRTKK